MVFRSCYLCRWWCEREQQLLYRQHSWGDNSGTKAGLHCRYRNSGATVPLRRKVEALQASFAQQQKDFQATVARQQKQIEALTAGLHKVSAQLEASQTAPQVVNNP